MALQIGATAPDFEAETTEGKIKFHDWIGSSWALLFSHPKDFTPVCTTELGTLARLKPEFDQRGVKLLGLSVDPVDRHAKWSEDIKETQGAAPNYPMIGDTDYNVSKLYDMLPAEQVARRLGNGEIEIAPLAFMRGRTLTNAAIILDEAQNTTSMQMKMFLTRLGENSRMIVTGDPSQIDLPNGQTSGLAEAVKLLDGVEGIAQVHFKAEDVIRHELVARIVAAYEGLPQKPANARS